jgi:5-methylcytosine-specific restriction endonuclease McrA
MALKDRVKRKAYNQQYNETHRDQIAEVGRWYREGRREQLAERGRRYREEHRDSINAQKRVETKLTRWVGKMEVIERLGGVCRNCGYKDDLRALQVDHVDPATKTMGLSGLGRFALKGGLPPFVIRELEKCQLLCANCHAIKTHMEQAV